MRIRKKAWARPELEQCEFYTDQPQERIGNWKEYFAKKQPLQIELGCGKGGFISKLALRHPEKNFLAVDLIDAMLGLAKRNIEHSYKEAKHPIDNVLLARCDIERIFTMLNEQDQVERIYINFCNPWPRGKHHKKRLTHTKQLQTYKTFLQEGGQIHFKTDDDALFASSLRYFSEAGYEILDKTYDLHEQNKIENIMTEHEVMFSEQGIKIKALIAKYQKEK